MFLVKTVWIYQMRTWKFSVKTVCHCFNIKILVKSHGHRYGVWENHNINWDQRFWHADIQLVGSWLACIVQYSCLSPLLSIWFNTFVLCLVLSPIILICPPLNRVVDTSGTCSFKYEFFSDQLRAANSANAQDLPADARMVQIKAFLRAVSLSSSAMMVLYDNSLYRWAASMNFLRKSSTLA